MKNSKIIEIMDQVYYYSQAKSSEMMVVMHGAYNKKKEYSDRAEKYRLKIIELLKECK